MSLTLRVNSRLAVVRDFFASSMIIIVVLEVPYYSKLRVGFEIATSKPQAMSIFLYDFCKLIKLGHGLNCHVSSKKFKCHGSDAQP